MCIHACPYHILMLHFQWVEDNERVFFFFFFILRILSIFNTHTHTQGEGRRFFFFKETYSGIYPKEPNSWIHSTWFKSLLLKLIFQCGINLLFFLLRILSIFNTHTHMRRGEKIFLKKLIVVYIQKGILLFHSI